jgi:hypothetical protein
MQAEFSALVSNHTWDLLPRPPPVEQEAAVATQERDEAAAHSHDALARATSEREAAEGAASVSASNDDDYRPLPNDGSPRQPLHAALLAHEADAIINLHAQAVVVQNIRSLFPAVLDIDSDNYTRWRH